jgi:hypothetical protein
MPRANEIACYAQSKQKSLLCQKQMKKLVMPKANEKACYAQSK